MTRNRKKTPYSKRSVCSDVVPSDENVGSGHAANKRFFKGLHRLWNLFRDSRQPGEAHQKPNTPSKDGENNDPVPKASEKIVVHSKISSSPVADQGSLFSSKDLFGCIHSMFEQPVNRKGLRFSLDHGKNIPSLLRGEIESITKIVSDLISNSIQITSEGSIDVACLYNDNRLTFSISDTGIGYSEEQIASFDRLLSNGARPEDVNYLLEAKKACAVLGGEFSLKSEERIGSVYTVTLPVEISQESGPPVSAGEAMINRWFEKHKGNPELIRIFTKSLGFLRNEFEALELAIDGGHRQVLAGMLHSIKGFPGGFGLTEIYDLLIKMETDVQKKPFDESSVRASLGNLTAILESIPEKYYSTDRFPNHSGAAESEIDVSGSIRGCRILVAEDEQTNREMIGYVLKQIDMPFEMVTNGDQALRRLKAKHFDLLLLDMRMPVMGGFETVERIRSDGELKDLKIVAVTADAQFSDGVSLRNIGCDDVIAKPIDLQKLSAVVREMLI